MVMHQPHTRHRRGLARGGVHMRQGMWMISIHGDVGRCPATFSFFLNDSWAHQSPSGPLSSLSITLRAQGGNSGNLGH